MARNPGRVYNPLVIRSQGPQCKTHLMHAIGNAIGERDDSAGAHWFPACRLSALIHVQGEGQRIPEALWQCVDGATAVFLDDLSFFASSVREKGRYGELVLEFMAALVDSGTAVVLAFNTGGAGSPEEALENRIEELAPGSRPLTLGTPDQRTLEEILAVHAALEGVELSREMRSWVASRLPPCPRVHVGMLKYLKSHYSYYGLPAGLPDEAIREIVGAIREVVEERS